VIGSGPEEKALRRQATKLGLGDQIEFVGTRTGHELVTLLNTHRVMIVPSRWQEPFGLVALEGIACGCVVIGAECGGLPDAIGPAGVLFACDNVADMARQIEALLGNEKKMEACRASAPSHLRDHTAEGVARKYLEVLEGAARWSL
jgi:glycosyltransferase involved in cell wall biosynthesis